MMMIWRSSRWTVEILVRATHFDLSFFSQLQTKFKSNIVSLELVVSFGAVVVRAVEWLSTNCGFSGLMTVPPVTCAWVRH